MTPPKKKKKLDQARQAKDQGHQIHGMKNYMVITLETIITGGLHTSPLVGTMSGWMNGWKNKKNVLGFGTQTILNMHVSYFSIANDPAYQ